MASTEGLDVVTFRLKPWLSRFGKAGWALARLLAKAGVPNSRMVEVDEINGHKQPHTTP